jgi:uncharacterized membrane protein YbhN (UPF0104 family)
MNNLPEATSHLLDERCRMKKFWHWVRVLIAVAMIGAAMWLLYHQVEKAGPKNIIQGMLDIPPGHLLLAVALTVLNYVILVGYDWAAVRYVQHPLKFSRIAFASFICYAFSHNFGWIIGGPASRYRLYSAAGLSTIEVAKLVAMLAVAYWTGFFALAGLVFVIWPPELPPELTINDHVYKLNWMAWGPRPLGALFILGVTAYLAATAFWKKPIRWRGHEFSLPPLSLSLFQVTTAMLDIAVAGSVMYVLLPKEMHTSFSTSLSAYMMAMLVVITIHIPGGIGVLELVVMAILDTGDEALNQKLFGTLLVYRAIYYWLPLAGAAIAFAFHEVRLLRHGHKAIKVEETSA